MITLGLKAPDRQTAIDFLIARGVILQYEPQTVTTVPAKWEYHASFGIPTFDHPPTEKELSALIDPSDVEEIPEHDEVVPEVMIFDSGVLDTDGLRAQSSPIVRTLTAATKDTPAVMEDAFYAILRFKDDQGGLAMAAELDKGGTVNNAMKLEARAELKAEAAVKGEPVVTKGGRARTIGDVTVFTIGGETGIPAEELGRVYL